MDTDDLGLKCRAENVRGPRIPVIAEGNIAFGNYPCVAQQPNGLLRCHSIPVVRDNWFETPEVTQCTTRSTVKHSSSDCIHTNQRCWRSSLPRLHSSTMTTAPAKDSLAEVTAAGAFIRTASSLRDTIAPGGRFPPRCRKICVVHLLGVSVGVTVRSRAVHEGPGGGGGAGRRLPRMAAHEAGRG